ncbi:hypothetical protein J4216_00625 [Candidatus Woesearchaeota archaeon]|nr:hypothetical protein [Candidatus Woesearchaeota archaeon]
MYEINVDSPQEELKRADHLVYVSLKYTRTCDIMKNAIKRMIASYELSMIAYLESLRKNKKIADVPGTAKERSILVKNLLGNAAKKYFALYNLLKKIDKAEYTASEEFRKNVALTTKTSKPLIVKVDDLYEYLDKTKEFVKFIYDKI